MIKSILLSLLQNEIVSELFNLLYNRCDRENLFFNICHTNQYPVKGEHVKGDFSTWTLLYDNLGVVVQKTIWRFFK